jgi:hypothetical protein
MSGAAADMGGSYREAHAREGVALPRAGLRAATASPLACRASRLRTDSESRERRAALSVRSDIPEVIILAPHHRGDVQALVDAMLASQELAPHAQLLLTTERDEMEAAITGGAVISP